MTPPRAAEADQESNLQQSMSSIPDFEIKMQKGVRKPGLQSQKPGIKSK